MSGPAGGDGYTLGKPALQQIAEVIKAYGGGGGANANRKFPYRPTMTPGSMDAVVVNAITQANGSTYGSGTATITMISVGNNGVGTSVNSPAYNGPQVIYNWSQTSGSNNGNTVVAGTHIEVRFSPGGFLELGWNDGCPGNG